MTDDTNATGQGHDADQVSVSEAAARLGVTPDAIRARIRRGTLEAVKDEHGAYVVTLPRDTDTPPTGQDTTGDGALIDQLRSEVVYLRGQLGRALEEAADERKRADIIQIRYMDALPPKTQEGPSEPPGSSQASDPPVSGSGHGHDADTTPVHGLSRFLRWLRGS